MTRLELLQKASLKDVVKFMKITLPHFCLVENFNNCSKQKCNTCMATYLNQEVGEDLHKQW